jgi:hypothetical protein
MYGTPQYPPEYGGTSYYPPPTQYPLEYGGTSYYPPPTYQQPFPVSLPPAINGPPPAPPIHPPIQTSSGTPSTSAYSTSERTTPSYVPYGLLPPRIWTFHFLVPHNPWLPHILMMG